MTRNPFVFAAQDPLAFFAMLGYALFLATLSILSTVYVWNTLVLLRVKWRKDRPSWNSPYVPPSDFTLRAASVPFVLAVTAWALGGIVYLIA